MRISQSKKKGRKAPKSASVRQVRTIRVTLRFGLYTEILVGVVLEKIIFENGLTVALDKRAEAHSAAVSIYVAAGNRFEKEKFCGAAHFIEHMLFKGTVSRSSDMIAREADLMGGQLNAYTAKEYTCFYSRALTSHVPKTLDLMCDMLCCPRFDPQDIKTEKGVVLEEIGMYEDSPEDRCSDMLTALCYNGHSLGFNILGTRESVQSFDADMLREFMAENYVPERIVVSVCGNFDRDSVLEILHRYFDKFKNTDNPLKYDNLTLNGGLTLFKRKSEQTQVSFCFNGLPHGHELRHAASFYSSIVGGAASSRINRRIREELGLAYSVYSFSSLYLGTGVFGISAGLAPKSTEKFFSEVAEILKKSRFDITDEEMELTREQFKAGTALSNESLASIAASMGRQLLKDGDYINLEGILKQIDAVTLEQINEAARLITDPEVIALSAVGETKSEAFYKKMLEYLN